MGRAPCCDKNGLKKGPWTPDEDQKLIDYIQKNGHGSWRTLPKNAGLQRCGKSCRLRWTNYLRPDIKRGRFSFDEEETIIQLHSVLGNKWSAIAARLPGRTDNEIKNYWNTHIRKRLLRNGIDPVTHSRRLDLLDLSTLLSSPLYNSSQLNVSRLLGIQPLVNPELLRFATSLLSAQRENSELQVLQNLQENQYSNPQFQDHNQFHSQPFNQLQQPSQIQDFQACTTSNVTSEPYLGEPQLMQLNAEQFQQETTNFTYQDSQPNVWQDNAMISNLTENFVPIPYDQTSIMDPLPESSNFQSNNTSNQNFSFCSVRSTPTSSPTPLNSCSTYINSSTEDERDSYCSNNLKFEIPEIWDMNEFM